jgi:catechol 2,3-dioxygenase-like lactoylglutathione lyase family enzyme
MSTPSPLAGATITAFSATAQPDLSKHFYKDILGFKLVSEDDVSMVFNASGVALRVQIVETVFPTPYTSLGWRVPDFDVTVRRLAASGVKLERFEQMEQDYLGVWMSPGGARVGWFKDPDGNLLSVSDG